MRLVFKQKKMDHTQKNKKARFVVEKLKLFPENTVTLKRTVSFGLRQNGQSPYC